MARLRICSLNAEWMNEWFRADGSSYPLRAARVTLEQITEWRLPTRPAKKSDPLAAKWGGTPAVELDAIDPNQLNELIDDAIGRHVDEGARTWSRSRSNGSGRGLLALRGFLGRGAGMSADTVQVTRWRRSSERPGYETTAGRPCPFVDHQITK